MRPMTLINIFLLSWTLVNSSFAKVDPPNYHFTLKKLEPFYPNNPYDALVKKFGKGEIQEKSDDLKIIKFFVAHTRYKFPVFIQVKGNRILDFYARLPNYFLHNIFHQSLINRYGKQDTYKNMEGTSIYVWNNQANIKIVYVGACTITCFPIYLSGMPAGKVPSDFTPLLKKYSQNFIKHQKIQAK